MSQFGTIMTFTTNFCRNKNVLRQKKPPSGGSLIYYLVVFLTVIMGYRFLVTVKSIHFAIVTDIMPNIHITVIINILIHYFIKNSDQPS